MSRKVMQQALEALENAEDFLIKPYSTEGQNAIKALRQALETEKQEPVAWMFVNEDGECEQIEYGPVFDDPAVTPLYTAPPKREWHGLTDEEIAEIAATPAAIPGSYVHSFACAIEAKLKEKNHG